MKIREAIETLQALESEGVTDVHACNNRGIVEPVERIGPERFTYDDGAAVGVAFTASASPGGCLCRWSHGEACKACSPVLREPGAQVVVTGWDMGKPF